MKEKNKGDDFSRTEAEIYRKWSENIKMEEEKKNKKLKEAKKK